MSLLGKLSKWSEKLLFKVVKTLAGDGFQTL